jgi:hypothetical protein
MTFVKGQSGNPAGKPKGTRSFTTKVREALEKIAEGKDYTYEEAFIKSILKKGIIDGDSAIIRLIWNYLDGMPVQKIAGDSDSPLIIQIAKEIADKNDTHTCTSNNCEG